MRWLFAVALLGCGKHVEAPPPALDRAQVYPLIVSAQDLATGPVRRPLVDGLVVTLAGDEHGHAKLLREPDLQGWKLDDAYAGAQQNLELALKRGDIPLKAEVGRDGNTVDIVLGHDWRAAACLLLPGVHQLAEQKLGARQVFAAIPNRDVLVLFADRALVPTVLAAEHDAQHRITDRILRIDGDRVRWSDQ